MHMQSSCFAYKPIVFFAFLLLWSSSLLWIPKDFTELIVIYTQFTRAKKIGTSRQIFCTVLTILRHARHSQFSTCKRIGPRRNVAPVLKILGVPRLPPGGKWGLN